MGARFVTIGLFTLLEAARSRLLWLLLSLAGVVFALSAFLGSIAITENRAIEVGVLAAGWRLVSVFVLGLFVIASLSREAADKGMELLFSLPMNRAVYFFGKLGGFAGVAAVAAVLIAPVLLLYAPPGAVAVWTVSLFCELLLVIAIALFVVLTFTHVTIAVSGLMGFYILARSIESFRLMASGPLVDPNSLAERFMALFFEALGYLLPDLASFTVTGWLIDPTGAPATLGPVLVQTAVYGLLISTAALVDLYRKPL